MLQTDAWRMLVAVLTSVVDVQGVYQVSEQRDFVLSFHALLNGLAILTSFRLYQMNLQNDGVDYAEQREICNLLELNRTLVLVLYPH